MIAATIRMDTTDPEKCIEWSEDLKNYMGNEATREKWTQLLHIDKHGIQRVGIRMVRIEKDKYHIEVIAEGRKK